VCPRRIDQFIITDELSIVNQKFPEWDIKLSTIGEIGKSVDLNEFFRRFVSCIFNFKKMSRFSSVTACQKKKLPKWNETKAFPNKFIYLNTIFLQIVIFVGRSPRFFWQFFEFQIKKKITKVE
jgi:hypothetical protein